MTDDAVERVILPSHPDIRIEDPLSICEDYEAETVPKWDFITKVLNPAKITSIESLMDAIATVQSCDLHTLESVLKSNCDVGCILEKIPALIKIALKMPYLFPFHEISVLSQGSESSVTLTREQIACILAHMFLCTLQPSGWNNYWVNCSMWYDTPSAPAISYLKTLLTYFNQLDDDGIPREPHQVLKFERHVLKVEQDWSEACNKLIEVRPGTGYEPREGEIQVIFSNKDIGFGVSGTQEEVVFGMSPELCVAMLFTPTLNDNEAIVIRGAEIVGRYSGFGRDVKFVGPWNEPWDWKRRCVVAIDAMELDYQEEDDRGIKDLKESNLKRELNKSYCGFSSVSEGQSKGGIIYEHDDACASESKSTVTIATGHWGCGAFGGNKYVKALIQLMAASVAKTNLVFYDISANVSSKFLAEFLDIIDFLKTRETSVGQIYDALLKTGQQILRERIENPEIFLLVKNKLQ